MPTLPPQTIVDTSSDAGLSSIYPQTAQQIPISAGNSTVYITNKIETVTNIINQDIAGGQTTEVQFNIGDRLVGDSGFTYDAGTDSLTVAGNITVANLRTNNLLYANGSPWNFGEASYANSNVANYLPVYTGNITANNFAANRISGNGSGITFITGSNVNGTVANAAYSNTAGSATTAGTVTTQAQPNITSVGTLSSLAVTGNVSASHYTGNGSLLTGITSTTAQTVTSNAQPNITSTGTLSGLAVSGTANTSTINSNGVVTISNTTPSTNNTSGALIVAGGIGSNANIHGVHIHASANMYAQQRIFAGQNAIGGITFSTEVFVGKTTSETFIQTALINSSGNGSADYTSFGENGDDDEGWTSLGFTGTTFNDPDFTISKPSDGYVFVEGMTNQGGNLILATGETGNPTYRDIIFATGGFLANNERFRLSHSTNSLLPYDNATMDLGNSARQFGNLFISNISISGTLTGITPNNNGYLQWSGNSSGDGFGYTTLNLVPDDTLTGGDQYVILDPTAPGHIHVRAGGTQDGSSASLFLGGENSYFMVPAGSNTSVYVNADGNSWTFGNDGNLQLPGSILPGVANTFDFGSANAYFRDAYFSGNVNAEEFRTVDGGITHSGTAVGINANAGKDVYLYADGGNVGWTFDSAGNLTLPGNTIAINYANGNGIFSNMVSWTTAPVANTSAGTAGQAAYDTGGNLYVCVATNTWAKFTGTTSW